LSDGNTKKTPFFKYYIMTMFILFLIQNFMRNSNFLFAMQIGAGNFFSMGLGKIRENGVRILDFRMSKKKSLEIVTSYLKKLNIEA